jgi:branched-chain amino acid transport system permease protein
VVIFAQQIANGLMIGGTYALVAIGFTLVFGVARILNLAHPEIFMVGAYAGMLAMQVIPGSLVVALLAGIVVSVIVGVLVERIALRPVRRGAFLAPLITSIGASIIIQNLAVRAFGAQGQRFSSAAQTRNFELGELKLPEVQVWLFLLAIVLVFLVRIFVDRTPYGRSIRAAAEDPEVAGLLGIDVNRVILLTIVLGSALAGVAGVTIGAAYNSVSPFMGLTFGLKGLVVMIVGGVGRITGAALAGVLLGVVEALSVGFLSSAYRDAIAFGVVLVVLLIRPRGLFSGSTAVGRL